jgi:hypothetical protein
MAMEIYTLVPGKATRDALRRLSAKLDEARPDEEPAGDVGDQDDGPGSSGTEG